MMLSKVRGQFEKFSGAVNLDEANPANTTVEVPVETASINTREAPAITTCARPISSTRKFTRNMTFRSTRVKIVTNALLSWMAI